MTQITLSIFKSEIRFLSDGENKITFLLCHDGDEKPLWKENPVTREASLERESADKFKVLSFTTATIRISKRESIDEFKVSSPTNVNSSTRFATCNCRCGADLAKQLTNALLSVLDSCGSVRIALSYKTPEKSNFQELGDKPKVSIWNGQEPNPYMGHLAWGDAFVVTADSVSLISEACSTGKPVYVIGADYCKWKIADFHKSLRERGVVRPFTGLEDMSESWSYPPLNDTTEAAMRIRSALAARGWSLRS
ncbi:unnamed protein product [Eruca vesicaria subsp. sativa]|uniref:Uncharacterized protein n=1 Tax=Eruca vesicaria subsp. sativa TaxID=29727 RepID=A0ABC8KF52_ERUVS|nr:unnamed protein product [Eruca vesicaria subsp. sativa]